MKTTIDIADGLLAEAKRAAARRHTTVRALVEDGLRHVLQEEERTATSFKLRDASVDGHGLRREMQHLSHEQWLTEVYGNPA